MFDLHYAVAGSSGYERLSMRQTKSDLDDKARKLIDSYRLKCFYHARKVNRAQILLALDRDIPESQIMAVPGIRGVTVI